MILLFLVLILKGKNMSTFVKTFSISTPPGTDRADTLDTTLQDDKNALNERMALEHVDLTTTIAGGTSSVAGASGRHKPGYVSAVLVCPTASLPASPIDGTIAYDTTVGKLKIAYGGSWETYALSGSVASTVEVPVGVILPYGGPNATPYTTVPTGYLLCNGVAVSRTTYADLYGIIGVNFGYGDNSTTFNLPDLRGMFLRGLDTVGTEDVDGASKRIARNTGKTGRNIGSYQSYNQMSHTHVSGSDKMISATTVSQATLSTGAVLGFPAVTFGLTGTGGLAGDSQTPTTSEVRPKNVYVNYIIKAL